MPRPNFGIPVPLDPAFTQGTSMVRVVDHSSVSIRPSVAIQYSRSVAKPFGEVLGSQLCLMDAYTRGRWGELAGQQPHEYDSETAAPRPGA
jgi:hypothetical protein